METLDRQFHSSIEEESPEELIKLILRFSYYLDMPRITGVLTKLSSVSSIVFSEKVSSAAIGSTVSGVNIYLNKAFIKRYIHTPECLIFLLCHELYHKIRGDIYAIPKDARDKDVQNFAYDMIINRLLCQDHFKKPIKLLNTVYGGQQLPLNLLNHPAYVKKNDLLKDVNDPLLAKLSADLYKTNWNNGSSKTSEIIYQMCYEIFDIIYGKVKNEPVRLLLLGDHDSCLGRQLPELLKKEFRGQILKASKGELMEEEEIQPRPQKINEFSQAVISALQPDSNNLIMKEKIVPEYGFMPFPGRKEIFLINGGFTPLFYPNQIVKKDLDEYGTNVYIDCSGSTEDYWNILFGLLLNVKEYLNTPMFAFSNIISNAEFDAKGMVKIATTYGTDIDCVMLHSLKKKFKRVLIITDGDFCFSRDILQKFRKNTEVFMILTGPRHIMRSVTVEIAGGQDMENIRWWCLDKIFNRGAI